MSNKKVSSFYFKLLEIAGKTEGFEPKTEAEEIEESIQDLTNQLGQLVTPDGKAFTDDPRGLAEKLSNSLRIEQS